MKHNWTRKRISERWGRPFWDVVRDVHYQGFNRTKAALIVGMERRAFNALLRQNPSENPWGSSNVIATYVLDTGEPFVEALSRLQSEGHSYDSAARALGYAGKGAGTALKHAMQARGVEVKFEWIRPEAAIRKKSDRGPNMEKGWPTWEKVYAICKVDTRVT